MYKNRIPILLSTLAIVLSACSFSLAADVTPPPGYKPPVPQTEVAPVSGPLYPLVPPDPTQGEAIYTEKCAPCHGPQGLGDGPQAAQLPNPVSPIGSADLARQSTPADWYSIVTEGNLERFMPPFSSLSAKERWDVVAYTYNLSYSEGGVRRGAQVYQDNCVRCHGENGRGDGVDAASLSVKPANFSDQEFMASMSQADFFQAISQGIPPEMPSFSDLSEADRWALSDYLRSLPFAGNSAMQALAAETPVPAEQAGSIQNPQQPAETPGIQATESLSETVPVGTVMGKISNASGIEIPGGMTVTLHAFDEMQIVLTDTTTLAEDGSYAFQDIELPAGRSFLTTVTYNGNTYGSEIATISTDTTEVDLPITVYETTSDTSSLVVDRLHMFFEFANQDTLQVIELYIISNQGDKVVAPAEKGNPTLTFQLPEGATNLEFQDGALGERYVETPNGFGDTALVRPGQSSYQVLFAYQLPFQRNMDLTVPVNLPVTAGVLMAPEGTVKLSGENLQDAGVQDVQGTSYHMYNVGQLQPNQSLDVKLTGGASTSGSVLNVGSGNELLIGVAAFGVVLIIIGLWLFMRNRKQVVFDDGLEGEAIPISQAENEDTIMDAILALDDLYRDGEIPEDAYRKRREQLKDRLREVMK